MSVGDMCPVDIISDLNGYIVVLYFWSKSCPACHANMDDVHRIRDAYSGYGLETISIHRPMNESDLDESRVCDVAKEIGITEKLIFDSDHKIGDEMGVEAWPTYFLFDREGRLRRHAKGQFGIRMIEQALLRLVDEEAKLKSS